MMHFAQTEHCVCLGADGTSIGRLNPIRAVQKTQSKSLFLSQIYVNLSVSLSTPTYQGFRQETT